MLNTLLKLGPPCIFQNTTAEILESVIFSLVGSGSGSGGKVYRVTGHLAPFTHICTIQAVAIEISAVAIEIPAAPEDLNKAVATGSRRQRSGHHTKRVNTAAEQHQRDVNTGPECSGPPSTSKAGQSGIFRCVSFRPPVLRRSVAISGRK